MGLGIAITIKQFGRRPDSWIRRPDIWREGH